MDPKSFQEYILCSAIHYEDGKIYEHQPKNIKSGIVVAGRRHHNCILTAKYLSNESLKLKEKVQGFITNTDRFVDRIEVFQIAKKTNQFLLEETVHKTEFLYSEDVW
jgi:hypothetical protein